MILLYCGFGKGVTFKLSPRVRVKIVFMKRESNTRLAVSLKGSAGLFVAVLVVAVLLISLPAYRLFFGISVLIGLVIAGGLTLRYRLHPIKDVEVENKRPLGL